MAFDPDQNIRAPQVHFFPTSAWRGYMTTSTVIIISGIVAAFLLFGGILAWTDFYSRQASRPQSDASDAHEPVQFRDAA
jgi:hypothetical protein